VSSTEIRRARAVAHLAEGYVLASVEVAAPSDRVFRALASEEIVRWWVRPGVFDTREWTGDVRVGGHWRTSGDSSRGPYSLGGEFLVIEPAHALVHTWQAVGTPAVLSTVTYLLESLAEGTRITLRHQGFASREGCANTGVGWETSFEQLAVSLGAPPAPDRG